MNVIFLQRTSQFALADGTSFLMGFFVLKDKKYNLSNQYNFLQSVNNNQYKQTQRTAVYSIYVQKINFWLQVQTYKILTIFNKHNV